MAGKIFKKGFIPSVEQMPAEHTHKRAKLVYNVLRILVRLAANYREAAMKELQAANSVLHDRARKYLGELTPEEIAFFIGPRPTHHDDGTLAIYDPIKDNPLLMRVYHGEQPSDASKLWKPGDPVGHELEAIKSAGRIVVGRN